MHDEQQNGVQRGRPRRHRPAAGLVRRNLLVDAHALERLCSLYGASSESEAVRQAVDLALLVHEGQVLGEWLSARGGPVDAYGRTTGRSRLPVHLSEGAAIPADDGAASAR